MKDYIICTDSGCDIRSDVLEKWNVPCIDMTFEFDGDGKIYTENDISIKDFYDRMRNGGVARTAAINPDTFKKAFESFVKDGKDVLYLCFSSGLSTTFNSSRLAAEEVSESYPESNITLVDTLCASVGQGLMVYLAAKKKSEGATLEQTAAYVKELIPRLCHWFTVDDLEYLKRGGRISSAAALVGSVLSIKPIITVDNEGHLISTGKVRGRKAAINTLVEKYGQYASDKEGTAFVCHSDCPEDVALLKSELCEKYGAKVELVSDMGPIIGAHVGPGTVAVVFVGKER